MAHVVAWGTMAMVVQFTKQEFNDKRYMVWTNDVWEVDTISSLLPSQFVRNGRGHGREQRIIVTYKHKIPPKRKVVDPLDVLVVDRMYV